MNRPHTETIRDILSNYPQETLADALSIFLGEGSNGTASGSASANREFKNFAQAILHLKKTTSFAELDLFTTEADLVYVQAGDRRILLTDRNAASEQKRSVDFDSRQRPTDDATTTDESPSVAESMDTAFENNRFSNLEI